MHGTRLVNDKPDSPHRFVDKMRGEIYCGFAEQDDLAPPSTIETLGKLFKEQTGVRYRAIVHPGTVHGYALPDRDIFDKAGRQPRLGEHLRDVQAAVGECRCSLSAQPLVALPGLTRHDPCIELPASLERKAVSNAFACMDPRVKPGGDAAASAWSAMRS